jgi:ribonuclease HII
MACMLTVGLDEVGRGCWAGPLVAGAVVLPANFTLADTSIILRDSKKLSSAQREKASIWIKANALAFGLGWVDPAEIDALGLSQGVQLAFTRAFAEVKLQLPYDEVIIDGNINYFPEDPKARAVVRADDIFPCVSAASIIAKVSRDNYMAEIASKYSGYGFEKHVGYGTAAHIAALKELGVSDIHRRSYKPVRALLRSRAS